MAKGGAWRRSGVTRKYLFELSPVRIEDMGIGGIPIRLEISSTVVDANKDGEEGVGRIPA